MIKFLGIDPGYGLTGYGIITEELKLVTYGAIETDSRLPFQSRLAVIFQAMRLLLDETGPNVAGMEKLFFGRNVTTGIKVAEARGVTRLAIQQAGLELWEYTPSQVKEAVSGYGRASKNQVQQMVKQILGLSKIPRPDDAADALAVAICLANRWRVDKISTDVEEKKE